MFFANTATLRWFRLWWTIGWCWVALVWYLSLMASPPMPDIHFAYTDKVIHGLGYCGLMAWFGTIYHHPIARLSYALFFVLMGVAIEFIQGMGPFRQFEIADMVANGVGVLVGFVLTLGPLRGSLHWLETQFAGSRAE